MIKGIHLSGYMYLFFCYYSSFSSFHIHIYIRLINVNEFTHLSDFSLGKLPTTIRKVKTEREKK